MARFSALWVVRVQFSSMAATQLGSKSPLDGVTLSPASLPCMASLVFASGTQCSLVSKPDSQPQGSLDWRAHQPTTRVAPNTDRGASPTILFLVPQPTNAQGLWAFIYLWNLSPLPQALYLTRLAAWTSLSTRVLSA